MISKAQRRKMRRKRGLERLEGISKFPISSNAHEQEVTKQNNSNTMNLKTVWHESDIPPELRKYYNQRYSLFSKYDEIKLDYDGWFSVTPEVIAEHIASRMTCSVIVDAFCGVGGNTIQFAKTCDKVIAIDIDPVRLECAKHNAKVYGVYEKVEFILGDFMQIASTLKADQVFLSPPWGGPDYLKQREYDIHSMPIDGVELFNVARQISPKVTYFVPRNIIHDQFIQLGDCELEKTFLDDRLKCWTVYYH